MRRLFPFRIVLLLAIAALPAACAGLDDGASPGLFGGESRFAVGTGRSGGRGTAGAVTLRPGRAAVAGGFEDDGSPDTPAASGPPAGAKVEPGGKEFTLNFVDADIQEFVRLFFDEVMGVPVIVDPSLSGRITVRTRQPVSRADALRMARGVLAMNGARLTEQDGVYRISGISAGPGGGQPDEFRVFALRHVEGEQLRNALQAFGADGSRIAAVGSKVILMAGSAPDLDRYERVVSTLDVDRLAGRSFHLHPLKVASARAAAAEIGRMFAAADQKGFEAVPIERMNAVLLIGTSASAMRRAGAWLDRLDQGTDQQKNVHVYPVQNRSAAELATVLQTIASGLSNRPDTAGAAADPGGDLDPTTQLTGDSPAAPPAGGGATDGGRIAVSADPATNSLVIVAEDEDYDLLRRAIDRLDVVPAQVLIEATIAEVTLNEALRRGVRWYFESGNHGIALSDEQGLTPGAEIPGFNYMFSVPSARVVISALEGATDVEIISSPALTVLDNQSATLKVGDQVPVATRSSRSTTDSLAPIVNEIEMRDTGIVLTVRPRISPSGLVNLEIEQEISDVVATTTSSINSPTIRQRSITSNVVVQSGTDIVLGGLISSQQERSKAGTPGLMGIPILGELFTSRNSRTSGRTELLIIMRPVVLDSTADVEAITAEIRRKIAR